ncbi:c-type cytochrome [Rugamonas apoptosis]|uniref:Cytochrome c4 n=1 Tax=Rugamonas apoptosis TaxID=2758570 RepID=A0A7W2FFB4_9BURK|nr:c-type cytochrome [Rugamonas apoptosis]MBA5690582.1 cytochrome c4 [Rugamonas apoptosis]
MKHVAQVRLAHSAAMLLVMLAGVSGCASLERSRALDDPRVAANTIAMQVCSNCHGVQGRSTSPNFPHLAGQSATYLEAQLKAFKGHGRSDPAGFEYMWGLSARLSDEQIAGLGRYFSEQSPPPGQSSDPVREQRGNDIFHNGRADGGVPACASCHGAKGEGMATFPRLAGQHADYIVKQLAVFQRTEGRPEGAIMKTVAHALSDDDIVNLAAYVQSIRSGQ